MNVIGLDGHKLSTYQRCRRRYAIESLYRYLPWHPTHLFSTVMRRAIYQLSSGLDLKHVTTEAVNLFTSCARQPGLDVPYGIDTYLLAMDYCATIKTILAYLTRITLVTLYEPPAVIIPNSLVSNLTDTTIQWSFLAHTDESGLLHRWVFVDTITEDAIMKQLHQWEVIGDIIVARAPLVLHLVAIGHTRHTTQVGPGRPPLDGNVVTRRYSPWCRGYLAPLIGKLRFKKQTTQDWKPTWFADNPKSDPEQWVDQMVSEGVHEPLMLHKTVAEPDKQHVDNFYRDLSYEAGQINGTDLTEPMLLPMSRPSCDTPYVCPHQTVCYSLKTTIDNSGLYERIEQGSLVTTAR